jgi:hypothetical protein
MSKNILGTAGVDTSALSIPQTSTLRTKALATLPPGPNTEHAELLKKMNELKTAVNDGFAEVAVKINELRMKQRGGRLRTAKNKKIR